MDGLRLDAIHSIYDSSPLHILKEINDLGSCMEEKLGRNIRIISETDRNDPETVKERERCGYGFSGQWNDDFHHALHCFLSGERSGYYMDYGNFDQIVHAYSNGFVYDGLYSEFLGRTRGSSYAGLPMERLVVFTQNHDQVGNRAFGERPITIMGGEESPHFRGCSSRFPFYSNAFHGRGVRVIKSVPVFHGNRGQGFCGESFPGQEKGIPWLRLGR